jgi:hypothetical protein
MKSNRRLVWLNLWLLISLLISFNAPLTTQATSTVFSNNPPYIILSPYTRKAVAQ